MLSKPWWRHQMETFSALLAICAGNSPVTGESPLKGQWRGALMFSSICAWLYGWVNNHKAGDLKRHRAHYDVTIMNKVENRTLRFCKTFYVNHMNHFHKEFNLVSTIVKDANPKCLGHVYWWNDVTYTKVVWHWVYHYNDVIMSIMRPMVS